ncbi:hypothetical protein B0H16DRAFT_1474339 [Mycena metata]|uniref:Uncharacterized protein n=1 Tax=Mycena metata TaxID=1033252 RepID=A0AAD7MJW1_9AGAR|nr:hypothetical protein B0H16DRAFT_1474339 [Mycena metata]
MEVDFYQDSSDPSVTRSRYRMYNRRTGGGFPALQAVDDSQGGAATCAVPMSAAAKSAPLMVTLNRVMTVQMGVTLNVCYTIVSDASKLALTMTGATLVMSAETLPPADTQLFCIAPEVNPYGMSRDYTLVNFHDDVRREERRGQSRTKLFLRLENNLLSVRVLDKLSTCIDGNESGGESEQNSAAALRSSDCGNLKGIPQVTGLMLRTLAEPDRRSETATNDESEHRRTLNSD